MRTQLGFLSYGLDRPLSGIGRYTVELASALVAHRDELELTLLTPFSGSPAGLDMLYPSLRLRGRLLPSFMAAGPVQIAYQSRRKRFDIVYDPHGVSPFMVPRSIGSFARVVTIHDMIPFVYPETHARLTNFLFHHYIPRSLRFVDQVITVSEASKRDIARFYQLSDQRISVIYNGVSGKFSPKEQSEIQDALERYEMPSPYILTVGALQSRKNLETLFEGYKLLRARGAPQRLVVVGGKAWKSAGVFQRLRDLGLEDEVILTGYVAEEDLPALYSGADVFVFPSLYEGFGLPPLEAMACGTPVVTSNSSSLPEVVGDAGIMLDPYDVKGFADVLQQVLRDRNLHRKLRQLGLARAGQFTWERAARAHIELYRRLAVESAR